VPNGQICKIPILKPDSLPKRSILSILGFSKKNSGKCRKVLTLVIATLKLKSCFVYVGTWNSPAGVIFSSTPQQCKIDIQSAFFGH
jgi:hypothetical protein